MIRLTLSLISLAFLTACGGTIHPSESYYTGAEAMRSAQVQRCRVLEVRQISIGAQSNSAVLGAPEAQIGTVLGTSLGILAGSQIGAGSGKTLAMSIGGSIGGAIGSSQGAKMAQKRMSQPGLEYSILNASGREEVIVQYYNVGDRIAAPGSTCRVSGSGIGKRVLPADHLPSTIARPKQTVFAG